MTSWRRRESETQARSREHNESTARARASAPADGRMSLFRCECGDRRCTRAIRLTYPEYESVRAYATRFAIARDHENPESEQLIEEHERFAVVVRGVPSPGIGSNSPERFTAASSGPVA